MSGLPESLNPSTIGLAAFGTVPSADVLVMWSAMAIMFAALPGLAVSMRATENRGGSCKDARR